ncbi:anthranilate synthase component I [Arenicella xantha]|uniref:Anthranilate synthase component 1 n=1 Tax=Arenicella xantha TaxID=644221 RepID=A0A395JP00_9GAMM|nr:anthranilate synthase component I [Arenicella xantha]RBP53390.1 anthranilate synthase component I [Arenicella xantha]
MSSNTNLHYNVPRDTSTSVNAPHQSQASSPLNQERQAFNQRADRLRAQGYTHLPVIRETLADLDTPVSTYLKLAAQPYTYLFESVQGGDKWGRYSIIGLPCNKVYRFFGCELEVEEQGELTESRSVADPLETVRELQAQFKVADVAGAPDMLGGLVGYFGYEIVGHIEPRLNLASKEDAIGTPDIMLMVSTDVLVFDNLSGRIFMVTLADLSVDNAFDIAEAHLDACVAGLASSFAAPVVKANEQTTTESEYQLHFSQPEFEAAVDRCRDYIRDGDIMQVVLSQRLSVPYAGRPFDLYRALRTINPSPYMYFMDMGGFEIVGSSPEILVRLQDDSVTVRPIAGTRHRGDTLESDQALEVELLNDDKELAEHLMLIDLGRNDVGRIATIGSVRLTEKMQVERYSHVMHIVSNVDGTIKPEYDAIDVLKATFPAGTVSGAPKIRAMEIIHELEPIKRGIYSGAVGYLGWNGNMDTAIAIRTAVIKDGVLNVQAGAGIVADSVPASEWEETLNKARAMVSAVEMATQGLGFNKRPSV